MNSSIPTPYLFRGTPPGTREHNDLNRNTATHSKGTKYLAESLRK